MASQVEQVKSKVDIVEVIRARVKLAPAGKNLKGLCPFHAERSPSFFVSPDLQMYKCFGCGESGDAFSFLERYEGVSFREALEDLAKQVGVKLESYRPSGREEQTNLLMGALDLAREYYGYILREHKAGERAREYLKGRKVNTALIDKFELGWAPQRWDSLVTFLTKKKGYSYQVLEQAGLVVKGQRGYYDRFRGRVMFPLADFRGRVVGFSGRLLEKDAKEAKYVNTPETSVYHKRELLYGIDKVRQFIRKKDRVYVVEGEFDVISSYGAGVVNVVGIKGSALTEEQVKLIGRLTRNVTLCLDSDAAGDNATKRGIEVAAKLGMDVEVVVVKGGKDPDEIARSDAKAWKEMVAETKSVYEYYIDSAFEAYGDKSGLGKKKVMRELAPILMGIDNRVELAHYVRVLAGRLQVSEEVVEVEVDKARKGKEVGLGVVEEKKEEGAAWGKLERYVWGLLLTLEADNFKEGLDLVRELEWSVPGLTKLAKKVESMGGEFAVKKLVESLPSELSGLIGEVYLSEGAVEAEGGGKALNELKTAVKRLKELQLKSKMHELSGKIAKIEGRKEKTNEDKGKLVQMQKEFSKLVALMGD